MTEMTSPQPFPEPLITGQKMTREEFLRRWELLPELKNAELIEGIVYVASPVSRQHGALDTRLMSWLDHYAIATPGCEAGNNSTWCMADSLPQPDCDLRILPDHGGQSREAGEFCGGAPELALEVCLSSTQYDFGPKLALYQRAGVREYITVELLRQRVIWRSLEDGSYVAMEPSPEGVLRSKVFPGLWLDVDALWNNDGARLMAVLQQGLATAEHSAFVEELRKRAHTVSSR